MQKSNWICTDIDYAQFRREAPEEGSNVFELARVNAYGDMYCVAHGFVYLDMDVNECKREMLISFYGWSEDDIHSDEFSGLLAEAAFEMSAPEYDTNDVYDSFETAAKALGELIGVDIEKQGGIINGSESI